MKISAVVDLDTISFLVAYNQFIKLENTGDTKKVKQNVRDFISHILATVEANEYLLYYQKKGHKNYRHDVVDNYKANRPETPEFLKHWGEAIRETYEELGAIGLEVIESDDAVSIVQKSYDYSQGTLVMCHNDKDIRANCPGKHYNFGRVKDETLRWQTISEEEADLLYHAQLLTGDSTDNIMGCGKKIKKVYGPKAKKAGEEYYDRDGIGNKTALKMLKEGGNYPSTVFKAFKNEFGEDLWDVKLKETQLLIGLLGPNQVHEQINTTFIPNSKLLTTANLFSSEEDKSVLGLFDD